MQIINTRKVSTAERKKRNKYSLTTLKAKGSKNMKLAADKPTKSYDWSDLSPELQALMEPKDSPLQVECDE